jgi:intraflagellar transport protein 122
MTTVDVPQSSSMSRFLERGDMEAAYKVACLGVTEADWKALALAALQVRSGGAPGPSCKCLSAED